MMALLINLHVVFVDESEINNVKEYNACFLLLMKTYKHNYASSQHEFAD